MRQRRSRSDVFGKAACHVRRSNIIDVPAAQLILRWPGIFTISTPLYFPLNLHSALRWCGDGRRQTPLQTI
jgi:hypothetical protein